MTGTPRHKSNYENVVLPLMSFYHLFIYQIDNFFIIKIENLHFRFVIFRNPYNLQSIIFLLSNNFNKLGD